MRPSANQRQYLYVTIPVGEKLHNKRTVGKKQYNITDHRENVYASITDRRIAVQYLSSGNTDYYQPDVVYYATYSSFGALQEGRNGGTNGANKRYGFNGQERDDEMYNNDGDSYDFGERIYSSRLGRFLSIDDLTEDYPWYTPYQFAGNKPIWAIDLDGLEEYYITHYEEKGVKKILYTHSRIKSETGKGTVQYIYKNADGKVVSKSKVLDEALNGADKDKIAILKEDKNKSNTGIYVTLKNPNSKEIEKKKDDASKGKSKDPVKKSVAKKTIKYIVVEILVDKEMMDKSKNGALAVELNKKSLRGEYKAKGYDEVTIKTRYVDLPGTNISTRGKVLKEGTKEVPDTSKEKEKSPKK